MDRNLARKDHPLRGRGPSASPARSELEPRFEGIASWQERTRQEDLRRLASRLIHARIPFLESLGLSEVQDPCRQRDALRRKEMRHSQVHVVVVIQLDGLCRV